MLACIYELYPFRWPADLTDNDIEAYLQLWPLGQAHRGLTSSPSFANASARRANSSEMVIPIIQAILCLVYISHSNHIASVAILAGACVLCIWVLYRHRFAWGLSRWERQLEEGQGPRHDGLSHIDGTPNI